MKRILKMVAIASALVIILVISIASVAMAAGPHDGTCPNPDCPNADCPNGDGTCDGDHLQYQHKNGLQNTSGKAFRYQLRSCQIETAE